MPLNFSFSMTAVEIAAACGFFLSILAALETRVKWIASFCALFGEGCRRTAKFTLAGIPISLWGAAFYLLVLATAAIRPQWILWPVMVGLGFELTFVYILAVLRIFCIFCSVNALVIGFLTLVVFNPSMTGPALAAVAAGFAISFILLRMENRSLFKPPAESMEGAGRYRSPVLGPDEAPVKVVEFSDYMCPACRKAQPAVRKIRERHAGKIRWVFKNLPLPQHKGARRMALAAHCAGDQGRFWEFHDRLYDVAGNPGQEELEAIAADLKLDVRLFRDCLKKGRHEGRIEEDRESAKKTGVTATPTFIINGRRIQGAKSEQDMERRIDRELKKKRGQGFATASKNSGIL